jgi:hypothetical protein
MGGAQCYDSIVIRSLCGRRRACVAPRHRPIALQFCYQQDSRVRVFEDVNRGSNPSLSATLSAHRIEFSRGFRLYPDSALARQFAPRWAISSKATRFFGQRVAADRRARSDSVGAAEFSVLCGEVADLRKKVARPQADLNAFADVQSKADAVYRTHNERAEPPMAGEDIVSYKIRQHRGMQKFSPKWKGVELRIIAADGK